MVTGLISEPAWTFLQSLHDDANTKTSEEAVEGGYVDEDFYACLVNAREPDLDLAFKLDSSQSRDGSMYEQRKGNFACLLEPVVKSELT